MFVPNLKRLRALMDVVKTLNYLLYIFWNQVHVDPDQ